MNRSLEAVYESCLDLFVDKQNDNNDWQKGYFSGVEGYLDENKIRPVAFSDV